MEKNAAQGERAGEKPLIEIEGVWFSYDGEVVLEDVNLTIGERDFVSVVGPNGGGKTTLLRLILGLLKPDRGRIRVFGLPPVEARGRIGYMPQYARFDPRFPVTVLDVVLMGRHSAGRIFGRFTRRDREIAREVLDQVGLADLADRPFSALSGGQRQRVLIARALACRPDLLLLDEPTANLDVVVEGQLYDLLSEISRHLTVILVSHELGFVSRFVKRVVCVAREVVVHPTSEITAEILNDLFGADMRMVRHDMHYGEGAER